MGDRIGACLHRSVLAGSLTRLSKVKPTSVVRCPCRNCQEGDGSTNVERCRLAPDIRKDTPCHPPTPQRLAVLVPSLPA